MEQREEHYTTAMKSIGAIIVKWHTGGQEEQSQELYQMSQMLDSLYALAPPRSRTAVGPSLDQLRTLHLGHLNREVDEEDASIAQPTAETSSEGTCLSVSALPVVGEATSEEVPIISGRPAVHSKPVINPACYHDAVQAGDVPMLQETEYPRGTLVYQPAADAPQIECFLTHPDNRPCHLAIECPDFMVTLNNSGRSQVMDHAARCHVCWRNHGKQGAHPNPCQETSYCSNCCDQGHHDLLCTSVKKPKY
jgi:hypothetical protein